MKTFHAIGDSVAIGLDKTTRANGEGVVFVVIAMFVIIFYALLTLAIKSASK